MSINKFALKLKNAGIKSTLFVTNINYCVKNSPITQTLCPFSKLNHGQIAAKCSLKSNALCYILLSKLIQILRCTVGQDRLPFVRREPFHKTPTDLTRVITRFHASKPIAVSVKRPVKLVPSKEKQISVTCYISERRCQA